MFLTKLGIIDFDSVDSNYVEITNKAIKWIRAVRHESNTWTLLPLPCRPELFPNMKNERETKYKFIKTELSNKIYEITNIWNCGIKKRYSAHQNYIYGWNDVNCNAKNLNFNEKSKKYNVINGILDINKQEKDIIKPKKIIYDRDNQIKPPNNTLEFYLDFETLNSNFGSIVHDINIIYDTNQYIFMIGIGQE